MIQLQNIGKSFDGRPVVKNISFTVNDKENLVLLGTSGCGKTTTLKMINRLIEPTHGNVLINGEDVTKQKPEDLRKQIGFVMQNIGLFPHYTIAENIAVVPRLSGWEGARIETRTQELAAKLHLPEGVLQKYPHQLSGGQQQRVGLARALMCDTSILLMDEPFGALDNVTRAGIVAEFKALEELKRKTIIMVTHDIQEAFELADRICLMDKGEIVQIGTPKELLYKPATPFARSFFDSYRLILEFKVVTLSDIKPFMKSDLFTEGSELPETTSVWNAMEHLKASKNNTDSFEEVTRAFYQYQNTQAYE